MAKWLIQFEDVTTEAGTPGVAVDFAFEGEPAPNGAWSSATMCALTLEWLWATNQFQGIVENSGAAVVTYQAEQVSSRKSPEGENS